MRISAFSVAACCAVFFTVVSVWGRMDYSAMDPENPEVVQASEEAAARLTGANRSVAVKGRVVDILGIPKNVGAGGVAIEGRVTALESAMKDLGAKVTQTEIRIELPSDVLFDFDKYDLRPDAREALAKVATIIRAHPGKSVRVEGHTDSVGTDEYNMRLSLRRAASVKQWLEEKEGLESTSFRIKGWGEGAPRETNDTEEGRQKNRRVEIIVEK